MRHAGETAPDEHIDRRQSTPLPVARSVAPDLARLAALFERIVAEGRYSNHGVLYHEYAALLGESLACTAPPVLFNNATQALITTLRALEIKGEVITTPFSFAASAHAIHWAGATPVFCDIDPCTLTLDPARVEAAIGPATRAILAVHIYGHPCDVAGLQALADQHGLKLIYDAAHAFATRIGGRPLHEFGDATIYSLHASKLTHCGEGGVLATADRQLLADALSLQNFGIADESTVALCGSNGKLSEASAALGLAVWPGIAAERAQRRRLRVRYQQALSGLPGIELFELPADVTQSEQYLVIRVHGLPATRPGTARDAVFSHLRAHNILARRYFYPLCSDFPHYRDHPSAAATNLPVSTRAAQEMLCLPFHGGVSDQAVDDIVHLIGDALARIPAQT